LIDIFFKNVDIGTQEIIANSSLETGFNNWTTGCFEKLRFSLPAAFERGEVRVHHTVSSEKSSKPYRYLLGCSIEGIVNNKCPQCRNKSQLIRIQNDTVKLVEIGGEYQLEFQARIKCSSQHIFKKLRPYLSLQFELEDTVFHFVHRFFLNVIVSGNRSKQKVERKRKMTQAQVALKILKTKAYQNEAPRDRLLSSDYFYQGELNFNNAHNEQATECFLSCLKKYNSQKIEPWNYHSLMDTMANSSPKTIEETKSLCFLAFLYYRLTMQFERVYEVASQLLALQKNVNGCLLAHVTFKIAELWYQFEQNETSMEYCHKTLELTSIRDSTKAECTNLLGILYGRKSNLEQEFEFKKEALEQERKYKEQAFLIRHRTCPNSADCAQSLDNLGTYYEKMARLSPCVKEQKSHLQTSEEFRSKAVVMASKLKDTEVSLLLFKRNWERTRMKLHNLDSNSKIPYVAESKVEELTQEWLSRKLKLYISPQDMSIMH